MKKPTEYINESGTALILALGLLTVLATLSIAVLTTTNIGSKSTSDYKNYQKGIYLADGGVEYGYSIVKRALQSRIELSTLDTDTNNADITLADTDVNGNGIRDIQDEINKMSATEVYGQEDSVDDSIPNATVTVGTEVVNIDIDFIRTKPGGGDSLEFAAGSEGTGAKIKTNFYYRIDAKYMGTSSSKSPTIQIRYKCNLETIQTGGRCI